MDPFATHGAFSWNELTTPDPDAALAFYCALFGWTTEPMAMPSGTYHVVKAGGGAVAGIMAMPKEGGTATPAWMPYVTVDDVDAVVRKASELGGIVAFGPQEVPGVGRFVVIVDPQGAAISAMQYARR